ncbi:MAG: ferredoxin [Spirochaetes bacterium]|nr:ferredoxin [Spirochaetota bacterium]
MADKTKKTEGNVNGKFYVDENCIGCGLCASIAENNFKMSDDGSFAFVVRQPEDNKELDDCKEAIVNCPVNAIGDDG